MALTGQLSDMSLAELIEFFCNQRKTGRLKIDYPRGHSVFYIREGELVDAKVGVLSGVEAVYFSLTLPNAAFDFSPDVQSKGRTINEPWTQVVLEGLRRLDEGLSPKESDAFGGWSPGETELAQMLEQVEHLDAQRPQPEAKSQKASGEKESKKESPASPSRADSAEPFSTMVESARGGGSKKKWVVLGVAAAVLLAVAAAAVPLMNRPAKNESSPAASAPSQPASPAQVSPAPDAASDATADADSSTPAPDTSASADAAADAARRAREQRERDKRRREQEAQKANDQPADASAAAATAPKPATPAPAGPKSVRVAVTYDEAGRVTQASVAGTTPGAEAYGSTAVRIARGRHFPAGKAGTTVVTIPVN